MAHMKSDPEKLIGHCAGAAYGCTHTWVTPRWKTCIYKHAAGATNWTVSTTLRDKVRTKETLGDRVGSNPFSEVVSQL
jgi:hypothetical protein